jgi:hypothetical protein
MAHLLFVDGALAGSIREDTASFRRLLRTVAYVPNPNGLVGSRRSGQEQMNPNQVEPSPAGFAIRSPVVANGDHGGDFRA